MKKTWIGILVVLAVVAATARTEMRIWTDKKGNSIEAEFVNFFSDKVILKTAAGKQFKVPQNGLSQKDIAYLKNVVPPKIDIEVNIITDSKNIKVPKINIDLGIYSSSSSSTSMKQEKIRGKVTITKKNRDPSCRTFVAHLYIFTKHQSSEEIKIVDKTTREFSFKNQDIVKFEGSTISIHYYNDRYRSPPFISDYDNYGEVYEGYLVFIKDNEGNIICTKGSCKLFENKVSEIKESKNNDLFDDDMIPLRRRDKK